MPEVSEAKVETAQVEEKPSEEPQVAEPEPSEAEPPAQEPVEETPEEKRERIRKELLESEEGKAALQSEADKRALKLRQEYDRQRDAERIQAQQERQLQEARAKREQNQNTYRQLQALKQTNPQEWSKYMDDPRYVAVWNEGLSSMPSAEEIESARAEGRAKGGVDILNQVASKLQSRPEMENLTQEEIASLNRDNFAKTLDGYVDQLGVAMEIYAKRLAVADIKKREKAIEETARKDEREKIQAKYREAGVVPEELEGKPTPGELTLEEWSSMTTAQRDKLREEHPERIEAMSKKASGL